MTRLRHLVAIATRELVHQRLAFAAALLAGLLAIVFPLMLWAPQAPAAEVRAAFAIAVLLPGLLLYGLVLGATLIAPDLAERRLSFYLARPVSIPALWLGKLVGATLAFIVAALLVLGPSWLTGARWEITLRPLGWWWPAVIGLLALLAVPALLAVVHTATVAVRSRSAWLLADLLGLATLLVIVVPAVRQLLHHDAHLALRWALVGAGLVTALIALLGGGMALARGRTDPARVHRAGSLLLWPPLLLTALVFAGFARWTVTPPEPVLAELEIADLTPRGDRVVVGGPLEIRGYRAAFLVDPTSGDAVRLGSMWPVLRSLAFSADGSTVAWMRLGEPGDERRPVFALEIGDDIPRRTGIALAPGSRLALSPDGSLLATVGPDELSVRRLVDGATLLVVRRPQGAIQGLRFAGTRQVVLLTRSLVEGPDARQVQRDRAWLLELETRSLRRTLDLPAADGPGSFISDGLVAERRPGEIRLHDPSTGELVVVLPLADPPRDLRRLDDGRWLVAPAGIVRQLILLSAAGVVERWIDLAPSLVWSIGPEIAAGQVVLSLLGPAPPDLPLAATSLAGLTADRESEPGEHVELLNIDTGERRLLANGVTVVSRTAAAAAASADPLLVVRAELPREGELFWWDPRSDLLRTVVTAPPQSLSLSAWDGAGR